MVALANGGLQLNALNQNIALNTTGGTANLVIEPNTGGASNGEVICFYGFQNLSDERLKTNVQPLSATEAQELFDGVEARSYDRVDGAAKQTGFVAQEVYKSGPLGKSFCKLKNFEDRELMTLDYQRMTAVLWQTCKSLQNKFGLVVTDVFTREVATKALPDKRAETVTQAAAEIIPGLVQEEGNYVVTTDLGNEFRGLEAALPGGAVHRQKDPTDRNATAVVDRAIQTLKKDLAGKVARDGGGWAEHVDEATEAYNARPHEAVTVAPEDVETMPAATFRVYQDNARKFKHNDELTRSRQRRLEEAGAFRAPTNAARSFQPQYGAVREVSSYDSMTVRATDGSETLLKHALPVPRGSAEPKARLTRPPVPLAVRQLRDFNSGPRRRRDRLEPWRDQGIKPLREPGGLEDLDFI